MTRKGRRKRRKENIMKMERGMGRQERGLVAEILRADVVAS